ncbi:hypothetical protein QTP70_027950 [Hemibagrus guttatus]|uniref:V-SNARE coiled-coil homology domain-containing protein n=1 Tax=Hemibagrus guttatus TaxID=175788 RepID=A0AAE0UR51_9TELE|nr:hypothetical protein QTP70_027950 [Hemibagrus guttatus]
MECQPIAGHTHTLSFTTDNLEMPINLTMHVFGLGEETRVPGGNPRGTGRTCKLHTHMVEEKGDRRLQQLQGDVEETKDIMVENYNKAIDRSTKLEDLDERADALLESSKQFQKTTRNLRVKPRRKVIVAGIALGLLLLLIIIIVAVYYGRGSNGENSDSG